MKKTLLTTTFLLMIGSANAQSIIQHSQRPYDPLNLEFSTEPVTSSMPAWTVTTGDKTIRDTLTKWAKTAGWTFHSGLWNIDRDFPVIGDVTITQSFPDAVRTLLDTTFNTDRPVHPCFYSNKILRVVPLAEPCQRPSENRGE